MNICPCCGEKESFTLIEKDFTAVYGQTSITSSLPVKHCESCGATFDADDSADTLRKEAFVEARRESVCRGLERLEKKISFTELEHCFSLAPKTLSKWKNKSKSPSATAAAFVNLLSVFPWLAYVGMSNYNSAEAYKIAYAAVLQKANENPANFVFPLANENYTGIALVHTNESYKADYEKLPQQRIGYSENIHSSTIQYKG